MNLEKGELCNDCGMPIFQNSDRNKFYGQKCIVTDLSHDISKDDPVFVGHQKTIMWDHLTHEETQKWG